MSTAAPYRSTPVFTNQTLPAALRRAHSTKEGVWALLKVFQGSILFTVEESGESQVVRAPGAVTIVPLQLHSVEPLEQMEMQVDFYDQAPDSVT